MIFWRGCGWFVFFGTFAWIFVLMIIVMSGPNSYQPDKVKAAMETDQLFGLAFALSALSVFIIARYRESRPRKVTDPATGEISLLPRIDEFMFIRMKYWTYVLVAAAVGMFIKSFFE